MTGNAEGKPLALVDDAGTEALRFDGAILVGRVPRGTLDGHEVTVDLVLPGEQVSRVHARLSPRDGGVIVEDLGSRNGTFINDQRVERPTLARDGDRIRFDLLEYALRDERSPAAAAAGPVVDPQGTVLRSPAKAPPAPVAPAAPSPAPVPDREDTGQKGGTVLGPVRRNLPKVWWPAAGAGTVVVKSPQGERVIDVDALAQGVSEPTLMVFDGNSAAYPYTLKRSGDINFWNIGKDPEAHDLSIVLQDPSVSAFHAKLVRRGDRWKISDMLSTNHTCVNGEVFANKFLQSKDRLRFGNVECVFLLPGPAAGIAAGTRAFFARLLDAVLFWRR